MEYLKEKVLADVNIQELLKFLTMAGFASILPFFIHQQWITGPIVNAVLILALFLSNLRTAMVIAFVPSLMALAGGLLPVVLAPVIPFIMISNVIYIYAIDAVYKNIKDDKKGYWLGIAAGSMLKFFFLMFSVNLIDKIILKKQLMIAVSQMMSWPQLITALTGGLIAWSILKWLKRI